MADGKPTAKNPTRPLNAESDTVDDLPFVDTAELVEPISVEIRIKIAVTPHSPYCNERMPPCELLVWNGVGGYRCARFGTLTLEHVGPSWPDPASRVRVLRAFDCLEAECGGAANG
jgi:hypothetical protein